MIEQEAQGNGAYGDDKDRLEHADGVNVDLLLGEEEHQKRSHYRGKQGAGGRHADGKSQVALTKEGHEIGGDAAGAAADQDEADGKFGAEVERLGDSEGDQGHQGELRHCADKDVLGAAGQNFEIFNGQRHAHCEHD